MAEWTYSPTAHRYREATSGRFLSASASTALRDDYLDRQRTAMADLAQRVVSGDLGIPDWERAMRLASRETFTVQYAYGRGGRNAMTAADRAQLGELITGQHTYLNGFARDLETGQMSALQVEARAQLYANAGVLAHESGVAASWAGSEWEERNVRGGSRRPCSECPALSRRGWVPGGSLPLPGSRSCAANCLCHLDRRAKASVAAESQRLRVVA